MKHQMYIWKEIATTTNLTQIMTSRQINKDNMTANEVCIMDMKGDCPTTKPTMIMTKIETNGTTDNEEMGTEEPLTPQNVDFFMITNTTSTPMTITLPKITCVHK